MRRRRLLDLAHELVCDDVCAGCQDLLKTSFSFGHEESSPRPERRKSSQSRQVVNVSSAKFLCLRDFGQLPAHM